MNVHTDHPAGSLVDAAAGTGLQEQHDARHIATRPAFVLELFDRVARSTPDRIAIAGEATAISYETLDRLATTVASRLESGHAASTDIVGIHSDDRVLLIASVLGALRRRCAFMPLAPDLPDARLDAMLAIAAPRVIVTDPLHHGHTHSLVSRAVTGSCQVISFDPSDVGAEMAMSPAHPAACDATPDDFCYVYFTSGSTGLPKAIAGRLKAIDHFVRWEADFLGGAASGRVSQLTHPCFDAFLRDVFTPLCHGGTVCVPPSVARDDDRRLVAWLAEQQIEVLHVVPSRFRSLSAIASDGPGLSALRAIMLAGEQLFGTDVRRWWPQFGGRARIVNLYGPSETTMTKFVYEVGAADVHCDVVPIGVPIPDARAIVLDEQLQPCETGLVGELYIRTPFRALGYYGNDDLTRQAFVPNPFTADPNDLLYRTGDLCRVTAAGVFELVGRRDRQVKVRGVRIELDEIEAAVRRTGLVADTAVTLREDAQRIGYLCAYVVLEAGATIDGLRGRLSSLLPAFMTPSAIVALPSLPLRPNGKLDRQALPDPQTVSTEAVPPSTDSERLVAEVWGELLGLSGIPANGNFFDLGGHSLLAAQALFRLHTRCHVDVPLRMLFDAPTVAGLAAAIDEAKTRAAHAAFSEEPAR